MAFSTYTELKAAITDWMARSDLTGNAADFITLAEASLNREIGPVTTDATLTGVSGSRRIDISSLSMVQPTSLHVVISGDEEPVGIKADGSFPYTDDSGQPSFAAFEGANIDFDCLLDQAYTFRLTYQAKLALSDAAPTNWLLADHPDVYLAASIVWGSVYIENNGNIQKWATLLEKFLSSTRMTKARERKSVLSVDAGLLTPRRYSWETN